MKENKLHLEKEVFPIHFEDRSGQSFERLGFAYVLRIKSWENIDWYGQLGKDSGRDIWGVLNVNNQLTNYCYQCANHKTLKFDKAKEDIDKIISGNKGIPDVFVLICGGKVSASMKEKIKEHASQKGIKQSEVWSGIEFEERLRKDTPDLIKRYCEGVEFPETSNELGKFVKDIKVISDEEILKEIAECFNRPAFITPFAYESNIPNFEKAIEDTIESLNTGIRRLRDGIIINKFPSRHYIMDKTVKNTLENIVKNLIIFRMTFNKLCKSHEIEKFVPDSPRCDNYYLSDKACEIMDRKRKEILSMYKEIYKDFDVSLIEMEEIIDSNTKY